MLGGGSGPRGLGLGGQRDKGLPGKHAQCRRNRKGPDQQQGSRRSSLPPSRVLCRRKRRMSGLGTARRRKRVAAPWAPPPPGRLPHVITKCNLVWGAEGLLSTSARNIDMGQVTNCKMCRQEARLSIKQFLVS